MRRFLPDSIVDWLVVIVVTGICASQLATTLFHNIARNQAIIALEDVRAAERIASIVSFLEETAPILRPGVAGAISRSSLYVAASEHSAVPDGDPVDGRCARLRDVVKARLLDIEEGGVLLHRFSPTGFYSSAVRNPFLRALEARSERQIAFSTQEAGDHTFQLDVGVKGKNFWVTRNDLLRARQWFGEGFTDALKTPDNTLVFVTPEEKAVIRKDQADCMGCLSQCLFSSWADSETNSTGRLADPRSFCIQKTLQDIAHGGSTEDNLMFAGHGAYNFKRDPFYSNGFVPTVKQLVDRILTGD